MSDDESPQPTSRKRILPAFVLCVVLGGLHRLYAGRIISGLVQLVWVVGASVWTWIACQGLIAIVHSGQMTEDTLSQIADWEETHGAPMVPMLVLTAVGFWIAADAALLLAGRFKDGEGLKIEKWL